MTFPSSRGKSLFFTNAGQSCMLSRRRLVVNGNNIFSNYGFLKDLGNFASVILTNL